MDDNGLSAAKYWRSVYGQSMNDRSGHGFLSISAVLEGGAHVDFSGIRILIAEDLLLEPSGLEVRDSKRETSGLIVIRTSMQQRKFRNKLQRAMKVLDQRTEANAKPLFAVIFGLRKPLYSQRVAIESLLSKENFPRPVELSSTILVMVKVTQYTYPLQASAP
ncbi:hypothetical protein C0995_008370 [Termitomyces sp. Mi166|nr:hypothetical protein C0995_008370 [Termitomyces sp. Mi166\